MRKSRHVTLIALAVVTAGSWLLAWSVPVSAQTGLGDAPAYSAQSALRRDVAGPITGLESILAMAGATRQPGTGTPTIPEVTVKAAPGGAVLALGGYTTMPVINGGNKDLSGGGGLTIEVELGPLNSPQLDIADSAVTGAAAIIWRAEPPAEGDATEYWTWAPADGDETDWIGRDSDDVDTFMSKMLAPYRVWDFGGGPSAEAFTNSNRYVTQFDLTPTGGTPTVAGATVYGGTLANAAAAVGAGDFYVGIQLWGTATIGGAADTDWQFLYDNITGFYTQTFAQAGSVLMVDDYLRGQVWVGVARGVRGGGPIEESSYRSIGFPVAQEWSTSPNAPQWLDGDAVKPVQQHPNNLIQGSGMVAPFDTLAADWWRVACRGPLPDSVANLYLPESVPYLHPSETNPTEPELGPFTVAEATQPGVMPSVTPTDLYVQEKGIVWAAPYAGNIFADEGSIVDPVAQAAIQNFVDQGGALLLSGGDIAWALTLNGATSSPFLQNVFGASYVQDDVGNVYGKVNGLAHDDIDITQRAGSTRGDYPLVENANPLSLPPLNSSSWWLGWHWGTAISPTGLRLAYMDTNDGVTGNFYTDGAMNFRVERPFGMFLPTQQQHWPDVIAATGAAQVAYDYSTGATAAVFMEHTKNVEPRGGRTAYLAFGLEAVSREFDKWDAGGGNNQAECVMLRAKVVNNWLNWNRTSRLECTVTAGAGVPGVPAGTPIPGALVVCEPMTGQGHPTIGMFTDDNGYLVIEGLAIDAYRLTAYAPGMAADHAAAENTWPQATNMEFSPQEDFSMSIAPNGTISGTVTDNTGQPLEGFTVRAAGFRSDGVPITNPFSGQATGGETVTAADGTYMIEDLTSGITYAMVANPDPKVGDQVNYATDDTTYSVDSSTLVAVAPAADTPNVDFALQAEPGNVTGLVYEEGTDPAVGIANAVVTVVGTDPAIQATADADGNYDFGDSPYVVPAGSRELSATAPGYQAGSITVDVAANGTLSVGTDIPLTPIPPGTITGTVTQGDGVTGVTGIQVQALFGPAGAQTVAATTTSAADGGFTFANIEAGVTYTIQATDTTLGRNLTPAAHLVTVQAGVTHTENDTGATILFKIVPLTVYPSGTHLVSAPYNYPGIDPAELYSEDAADFKMASWNAAAGEYTVYASGSPEVERGVGYFVQFTSQRELSRAGTPADAATRNQPFDIPLSAAGDGWNLIGNPYDFETDWTKITVLYNGQQLTYAEAVAQNLIAGSLFGYNSGLNDYFMYLSMAPFQGYWMRALADGVTIRCSNEPAGIANDGVSTRSAAAPIAKRGVAWSLQMVAQVGEYRDSGNYIGVAPEDRGIDMRYDLDEPPMARNFAGDDVTLYFPVTAPDGSARMLASDFRPDLSAGGSWDMVVDTTIPSSDVTVSWPDLRSLPRNFSAVLEDTATGETVSMRSATHYTFGSGDTATPRTFKVTLRSLSGANNPTPQVLGVDSMARGVTVSYRVASDVDMRVSILNQAGRVVRTLVADEHRDAGVHSEMWNGRDDAGRALPSGEYRIEFRATGDDGAVGRATARALR